MHEGVFPQGLEHVFTNGNGWHFLIPLIAERLFGNSAAIFEGHSLGTGCLIGSIQTGAKAA